MIRNVCSKMYYLLHKMIDTTHEPCVIAELDADVLCDAPLWGEDGHTLLLIRDESSPQPRVAPVHLVQPGHLQALVEHHLVVRQLEAHKPPNQALPGGERDTH